VVQNDLRRPAFAYLERVSCNIGGGNVAAGSNSNCPSLSDQFDVNAISGLQTLPQVIADAGRILVGLDDALPIAYTPTLTERQYLPLEDDVDSMLYEVVFDAVRGGCGGRWPSTGRIQRVVTSTTGKGHQY
ncbi:MAG: hypothetical protein AAF358_07970, partial [Pseudomonadota bacterium]